MQSFRANPESDSDSDSEWGVGESKRTKQFHAPQTPHPSPQTSKKVNTIWADTLEEDLLSDKMSQRTVQKKGLQIARAAESYTAPDPGLLPQNVYRPQHASSEEKKREKLDEELELYKLSKPTKPSGDDPFDDVDTTAAESMTVPERLKVPEKPPGPSTENSAGASRFKKDNRYKDNRKRPHRITIWHPPNLDNVEKSSDAGLVAAMARGLKEPKPELIGRVVGALGRERALELYKKTQETQKAGGMKTLNGDRLRTAGGVFLVHVREHSTDPEKEAIFLEEKKEMRALAVAKKKMRRKETFQDELEKLKALQSQRNVVKKEEDGSDLVPLPDSKELFLKENSTETSEPMAEEMESGAPSEIEMQ